MAGLAARLTARDGREPLEELYPALHSTSFLQKPVAQTRYFSVTECRLLEVGLKEPHALETPPTLLSAASCHYPWV